MTFNINNFQTRLRGGGARPSLFEVIVNSPPEVGVDLSDLRFKCRSTQLPQTSVSNIEVPYFGRFVKVRGNRTFADWTCTIIQDEDFAVRRAMEVWQNAINHFEANISAIGDIDNPEAYKGGAFLTRYSKTGNAIGTYELIGLWPTDVSAVALDWANNDIETFDVTFSVDWFRPINQTTGGRTTSVANSGADIAAQLIQSLQGGGG